MRIVSTKNDVLYEVLDDGVSDILATLLANLDQASMLLHKRVRFHQALTKEERLTIEEVTEVDVVDDDEAEVAIDIAMLRVFNLRHHDKAVRPLKLGDAASA